MLNNITIDTYTKRIDSVQGCVPNKTDVMLEKIKNEYEWKYVKEIDIFLEKMSLEYYGYDAIVKLTEDGEIQVYNEYDRIFFHSMNIDKITRLIMLDLNIIKELNWSEKNIIVVNPCYINANSIEDRKSSVVCPSYLELYLFGDYDFIENEFLNIRV